MFPGFTGGALVDADGRLVGVNTFGSRPGPSRPGSCLTIPVNRAWEIAERLRDQGSLKRGYLGIRSQVIELPEAAAGQTAQETALLIVGVEKNSPADAGGLIVGDILVSFAGAAVRNHEDLLVQLASGVAGTAVTMRILRAGQPVELSVTPSDVAEQEGPRERHRHGHHGRGR
jgi:S1-C subfamily serine protease